MTRTDRQNRRWESCRDSTRRKKETACCFFGLFCFPQSSLIPPLAFRTKPSRGALLFVLNLQPGSERQQAARQQPLLPCAGTAGGGCGGPGAPKSAPSRHGSASPLFNYPGTKQLRSKRYRLSPAHYPNYARPARRHRNAP